VTAHTRAIHDQPALTVSPESRKGRLTVVVVLIVTAAAVFAARLLYIQAWQTTYYRGMASDEHFRRTVVPPKRGEIDDATGHPLAMSVSYRSVYASTAEIGDPKVTAKRLAPVLGEDEDSLVVKLIAKSSTPVLLQRWLPDDAADAVQKLGLDGINLQAEPKRVYPQGETLDQVLGVVGSDDNGLSGLELRYNTDLVGQPGSLVAERDSGGDAIALGPQLLEPAVDGASLTLTIDRYLQWVAEHELDRALGARRAKSGVVVVLDPRTGGILALAARPTFHHDDADVYTASDVAKYPIPAIASTADAGPTFDVVTLAAGLESGAIAPGASFFNSGSFEYGGSTIQDPPGGHPSAMSMTQVLETSDEVGLSWIASRVGAPKFYRMADDLGFGRPTEVDLPGEMPGLLRLSTDPDWAISDLIQNAFGQGVQATPLQVTVAVATVANGGIRLRPHVVARVSGPGGERRVAPTIDRRVARGETMAALTRLLVANVADDGTGYSRTARVPGYDVAGVGGGSPVSDAFVGFGPAGAPRVAIYVRLDGAPSGTSGGPTAAAIFAALARAAMSYYQIPPSR
jgi:cell division protein FtsI/penicillin-binding protein 2